jgi:hypothetical protein
MLQARPIIRIMARIKRKGEGILLCMSAPLLYRHIIRFLGFVFKGK